ncbi:MAG TPA: alpha/beta hydrolase [Panacibacter sp.]|nr:alpha/beta hydrolase [Panacibacter sp.]HNP44196.1 alpha/beta hydrolase [Panacibacter sp.]
MKIKSLSVFKNPAKDAAWYLNWVNQLEKLNRLRYHRFDVATKLGNTVIWGINTHNSHAEALVIFPGFRTSVLFWEFDRALDALRHDYRIFLVETNGQPCLSDGHTPHIRSEGYGHWAAEVLKGLGIQKASVAGCSFGSTVCAKLAIVAPEMVDKVIMLNPGNLQLFSLSFTNLWHNLLPIFSPTEKNVRAFLDKAIFYKPHHMISEKAEQLLVDYELHVIKEFKDKAEKPYPMREDELGKIKNDVYLLLGDKDILFPFKKSIDAAKKNMPALKEAHVLKNTAHGIETSKEAIELMKHILQKK